MRIRRTGRTLLVALAASAVAGGCRFERRPDLAAEEPVEGTLATPPNTSGTAVEDSARQVLQAVTEAFAYGDVARVAQLTTRDALLLDQEEGIRWTRTNAAARLPHPLVGNEEGLGYRLTDSRFFSVAPGVAVFTLFYATSISGEDVPWNAVESWLLVRTGQGWRLQHLHRSRGAGRPGQILP